MMYDYDDDDHHHHMASLTNINHASDDLLLVIFSRLPFRSIATCKCVSKRFLSLILTPSFLPLFMSRQRSVADTVLVFLSSHELMLSFPPSHFYTDQVNQTLSSPEVFVKGNVCGCSGNVFLCGETRYTSGQGYFLCDPLTKETIQVPPLEPKEEWLHAVGFICNPTYTIHNENRQCWKTLEPQRCFRVVIITSFDTRNFEFEVDVWHSETGIWKQRVVSCIHGFAFAPHWSLSLAYEGNLYFMGKTGIFVYDPYSNLGDTLDYPDGSDCMNIMSFGFLGSTCGKLRIADIGHNDLRIWEMIEGEYWELVHHVNFSAYLPPRFCANYFKRVGGFHPNDGDIVYLYSYADGVFAANLAEMKFTAIPGYERSDLSPFQLQLLPSHQN